MTPAANDSSVLDAPAGCHYDELAADLAVDFFGDILRHAKGEWRGSPFVLADWQRDRLIAPLFGWRRSDGTRRYRELYCEVPRKNGKSTLAAGLALFLLLADQEPGAEIYSIAGAREQAHVVFDLAREMRDAAPEISRRTEAYKESLVYLKLGAAYKALTKMPRTKHGFNAHAIIADELHVYENRELFDALMTSTASRRQPLVCSFTTAGYDRQSFCWEKHAYALRVARGELEDPAFLAVIYSADPTDDWRDPSVWAKANPNLGVSIKQEYLAEQCKRAESEPSYENTFRRLHLNQWTEQERRWLSLDRWRLCGGGAIDLESLRAIPCTAGLDMSTTTDLTAFAMLFHTPPFWHAKLEFWMPEATARKRQQRDRVPYLDWIRAGWIHSTPGDVVDYDAVRQRINELGREFRIREIGFDPYNATQLATQLAEQDGFKMVQVRQGFLSMSAPAKHLERLVIAGQLWHYGNPVLDWMAANVAVLSDPAGNIKPVKPVHGGAQRVDGITALVTAFARAIVAPAHSVYESRGLLSV